LSEDFDDHMERQRQQARRRLQIGAGRCCMFPNCCEGDPLYLTGSSEDLLCYEHRGIRQGKTPVEDHHPWTRAIDPNFTLPMFGNDHRVVTVMSKSWIEDVKGVKSSSTRKELARLNALIDGVRQIIEKYQDTPSRILEVFRWLDETRPGWQQEFEAWRDPNEHE
jgi:hypothetical protein